MKHTKKSAENHVDTGISAWYNDSARGKNPELIFVRVPLGHREFSHNAHVVIFVCGYDADHHNHLLNQITG